jgi:hypothetical protein
MRYSGNGISETPVDVRRVSTSGNSISGNSISGNSISGNSISGNGISVTKTKTNKFYKIRVLIYYFMSMFNNYF